MTSYSCGNEQDVRITFLAMHFCMVAEMNRNASKKKRFNSEFSCIKAMPPL